MYAAAAFAVGVLLWGQGNLWNADYGALAGQDLDLVANAWRAPYELVGWAAVLLVSLVFFQPICRLAPFASLVFLGVQTAAIAASGGESDAAQRARWVEPPAAIYQFSATQNVIHVVLDEFQADVFNDIFQQDRAAFDCQFAGFQYFSDHAGSFPTTSFSMPAMLAGQGTGTRNRRRNSFEKRSSTRPCSKQCRMLDTTSTRCRSYRPIHSSSGWVRKQHRTGRARVFGSENRSSAATITGKSPRVSCWNCRSSGICRTRRRPSASTVQIHSIGP